MYLDLERIGAFIQTGRKEVGLTQAKLGERLGVSAQSVSNWERGETLPDVSLLPERARAAIGGTCWSLRCRRPSTAWIGWENCWDGITLSTPASWKR